MKNTQIIPLICLLVTLLMVGCEKNYDSKSLKKENAELQVKLEEERQARDALSERLSALEAQISKSAQEKQIRSEAQIVADWNGKIDKILSMLDRVTEEDDAFFEAQHKSGLVDEERRLKSIAREQESASRQIVAELRSGGFPKADDLDRAIKNFTSSYGFYVSYSKMSWDTLRTLGSVPQVVKDNQSKFLTEYNECLRTIRSLRAQK